MDPFQFNKATRWSRQLTFRFDPLVLDSVSLPVAWLIILWVDLCVREVDDEAKSREMIANVDGCVSKQRDLSSRLNNGNKRKLSFTSQEAEVYDKCSAKG